MATTATGAKALADVRSGDGGKRGTAGKRTTQMPDISDPQVKGIYDETVTDTKILAKRFENVLDVWLKGRSFGKKFKKFVFGLKPSARANGEPSQSDLQCPNLLRAMKKFASKTCRSSDDLDSFVLYVNIKDGPCEIFVPGPKDIRHEAFIWGCGKGLGWDKDDDEPGVLWCMTDITDTLSSKISITPQAKKVDPRVAMGFMKNPPKFLLIGMSLASSKPTTLRGVDNRGLMDTKHRVELGQKLMRRELRKSKPKTVKTYTCPKCNHEFEPKSAKRQKTEKTAAP